MRLQLEKLNNTRDLGGMPTRGGRRIRSGLLYRSGHLYDASPKDLAKDYGNTERYIAEGLGIAAREREALQTL